MWKRPLTAEKSFSKKSIFNVFSPFEEQSSPDYVSGRGRDCNLQGCFPIVDILFRSVDIRDRSAKSFEIAPKTSTFFGPTFFGGGPHNSGHSFFLNCTHFRSCGKVSRRSTDRPRRSRSEEKKKQQQNIKSRGCVIATGGPNNLL